MDTIATPPLLSLPSELIHHILSCLPLSDLLSIGLVNHALHEHSRQDTLYQPFVEENVPGTTLRKPANTSWRELFRLHHPYWFIPRHKIWFADNTHMGKLLIARYDYRLNAIEAYALVAERRQPTFQTWEWNPEAIIHTFNPRIQLDLNQPVVRLDAAGYANATGEAGYRLQKEIPMNLLNETPRPTAGLYSRLMLARPWPQTITSKATPIWPPLTIPSETRTRTDSSTQFRDVTSRPSTTSELSTTNFRLRKWIEFSSRPHGVSMRVGEDITTWATLPEECYTPTKQKPWQGIWCGDYAGHGCEFLAIMQPDNPRPLPERAEWVMRAREREGSVSSAGSWSTAPTGVEDSPDADAHMEDSVATLHSITPTLCASSPSAEDDAAQEDGVEYSGRIEAVKLTGDPNIPRGEYTFIAPDIGENGLIRVANEAIFKGARIVRSVGHIAARGFRDDDYMASQLILISHDRLAQYWETFGHVSFYQRVNIDEFTRL
ncbi:hypothetical protein P280DRAFT_284027 [Massarina eburnea CBS 473.64]|uniref:F-box domain-containing protein n=1 Tax=Massarina eburnea CBS 473.64 TaxID=1395130 RepID=A0A6A6S3Q6_9PLEO|nr:hypothetical protein P280DRAFT_284027 [Massarina eburnea CBS 473.64]